MFKFIRNTVLPLLAVIFILTTGFIYVILIAAAHLVLPAIIGLAIYLTVRKLRANHNHKETQDAAEKEEDSSTEKQEA